MPILDITIVGATPEPSRDDLAQRLADAAGAIFEQAPGRVWVKLSHLAAEDYAENGAHEAFTAPRPVFVGVLLSTWPDEGQRTRWARMLAQAIAQCCQRSVENVHILYEAPAGGRIAFGGTLTSPA